jgi:aryl-alcohol dehydrogenase-like predicted oxidoreductase
VGPGDRLVDEGALADLAQGDVLARLQRLDGLARRLGVSVAQLCLASMLHLPGMGPLIPSASTVAQLEENARAASVALDEKTIGELRGILAA